MKSFWWRIPALVLIVVSASCSGKGKDESGQANAAAAPESEASVSADAEGAPTALPTVQTKDLGALVDLIVADAGDLPRAEFDPAALADSLGNDPQKLFEWVRDRTWWAPYRGLLRGAKGVMLDRVGSNLDRAVLLGDLLRRAGHTVRIAHAQLPEARARELLLKLRPIPDQRRIPVAAKPTSVEQQRAIEAIMPGLAEALQEQFDDSKRATSEGKALVRSQADQLYAAVRDVVPQNGADDQATIAALQDHWWVELEKDGNWIAMDVLQPDSRMGGALAAASTIHEWMATKDTPSIPETDWHTVQIRVVVERYQGGATSEATALETVLRPAEVLERPITLGHMPMPWPEEIPDSTTDPNALKNAALWVSEWVPFLRVGDDLIVQSAFTDSGDLVSSSSDSVGGLGSRGAGSGDFGSALGGGEEVEAYATAEWIDYEIRVPGASTERLRRPLFDLLGPTNRSAQSVGFEANTDALKLVRFEALWSSTDILLQPCEFTDEFVADLISASFIANQTALKELSQERDPAQAKALALKVIERIDLWGPLPDLALWRSTLGDQPSDWYFDRPNVLGYRVGQPVTSNDRVYLRELIDIGSNVTGVRRGVRRDPFEVRLEQGVTDTVAEILTLGGDLRMAENTASVFAMAGDGSDRSVLIKPRASAAVRELGWPANATAQLLEDIDSGFMAVALRQPVLLRDRQRVGWWRVDPTSGETIGVMDTGYHAIVVDTAKLSERAVRIARFLAKNSDMWARRAYLVRVGYLLAPHIMRGLAQRAFLKEVLNTIYIILG